MSTEWGERLEQVYNRFSILDGSPVKRGNEIPVEIIFEVFISSIDWGLIFFYRLGIWK